MFERAVRRREPRARTTPLALAPALVALAAGCGREPAAPVDVVAPMDDARYVLDLAAAHEHSEIWDEVERIPLATPAAERHLARGWNVPNHITNPDHEVGETSRWADAAAAEVCFFLREVAPRRLQFPVRPYRPDDFEVQSVQVSLNGDPLTERVLHGALERIEVELPVASQRPGLNRLGFAFSFAQRPSRGDPRLKNAAPRAALFGDLEFECEDDAVRRRARRAAELVPGGSRRAASTAVTGGVVEQVSGSVWRTAVCVPPGARLVGEVAAPDGPPDAVFEVYGLRDGHAPEPLAALRPAAGSASLDVDLSALEGAVVALDFRVRRADGNREPFVGQWIHPLLLGMAPPAPTWDDAPHDGDAAAGVEELRRSMERAPVVAILIDACNPAYLGVYGDRETQTPQLQMLADDGVVFDSAYSSASYTIAAVGTMLSGRPAWEHGVWAGGAAFNTGEPTWPEAFAAAGYRTAGVVLTPRGGAHYGFDRGFEHYEDMYNRAKSLRTGDDVFEPVGRVLAGDDGRPLLLWVHLIEPHAPYRPPPPWRGRNDPDYEGSVDGEGAPMERMRFFQQPVSQRDLVHLEHRYRDNIEYIDDVLGRLFEQLEGAGLYDEALIAVFSDHGEAFVQHPARHQRPLGHGLTVHEEMARVPLIVKLPHDLGPKGRRVRGLVANTDILSTAADLVGVDGPRGTEGVSFAELLVSPSARPRSQLVIHSASLMHPLFAPIVGYREGPYKWIRTPGWPHELYDLEVDPRERHNLAHERPVLAHYLDRRLRERTGYTPELLGWPLSAYEGVELDDEMRAKLRALGYER